MLNYTPAPHWLEIKLQNLWRRIHCSCFSEGTGTWEKYGKRGISFYQPWADDYIAFREGVISECGFPLQDALSLDRIDNDGDYAPGNIRWANAQEQARNRRPNKLNAEPVVPAGTSLEEAFEIAMRNR